MKEEIVAGIKNAIERGESLDEAMQSFINAGYKSVEVREAANSLTGSATPILNPSAQIRPVAAVPSSTSLAPAVTSASPQQQQASPLPVQQSMPSIAFPSTQRGPLVQGTDKKKVIFLVVLLLVLVGILIATILYRDKILNAFS